MKKPKLARKVQLGDTFGDYGDVLDACEFHRRRFRSKANALAQMARESALYQQWKESESTTKATNRYNLTDGGEGVAGWRPSVKTIQQRMRHKAKAGKVQR